MMRNNSNHSPQPPAYTNIQDRMESSFSSVSSGGDGGGPQRIRPMSQRQYSHDPDNNNSRSLLDDDPNRRASYRTASDSRAMSTSCGSGSVSYPPTSESVSELKSDLETQQAKSRSAFDSSGGGTIPVNRSTLTVQEPPEVDVRKAVTPRYMRYRKTLKNGGTSHSRSTGSSLTSERSTPTASGFPPALLTSSQLDRADEEKEAELLDAQVDATQSAEKLNGGKQVNASKKVKKSKSEKKKTKKKSKKGEKGEKRKTAPSAVETNEAVNDLPPKRSVRQPSDAKVQAAGSQARLMVEPMTVVEDDSEVDAPRSAPSAPQHYQAEVQEAPKLVSTVTPVTAAVTDEDETAHLYEGDNDTLGSHTTGGHPRGQPRRDSAEHQHPSITIVIADANEEFMRTDASHTTLGSIQPPHTLASAERHAVVGSIQEEEEAPRDKEMEKPGERIAERQPTATLTSNNTANMTESLPQSRMTVAGARVGWGTTILIALVLLSSLMANLYLVVLLWQPTVLKCYKVAPNQLQYRMQAWFANRIPFGLVPHPEDPVVWTLHQERLQREEEKRQEEFRYQPQPTLDADPAEMDPTNQEQIMANSKPLSFADFFWWLGQAEQVETELKEDDEELLQAETTVPTEVEVANESALATPDEGDTGYPLAFLVSTTDFHRNGLNIVVQGRHVVLRGRALTIVLCILALPFLYWMVRLLWREYQVRRQQSLLDQLVTRLDKQQEALEKQETKVKLLEEHVTKREAQVSQREDLVSQREEHIASGSISPAASSRQGRSKVLVAQENDFAHILKRYFSLASMFRSSWSGSTFSKKHDGIHVTMKSYDCGRYTIPTPGNVARVIVELGNVTVSNGNFTIGFQTETGHWLRQKSYRVGMYYTAEVVELEPPQHAKQVLFTIRNNSLERSRAVLSTFRILVEKKY